MNVVTRVAAMRSLSERLRREGRRIALVPTMGALHEGHLSLVRLAREHCDEVVVSIFVNPIQFGPGEDYDAYPRDLARDTEALSREGAQHLFHPRAEDLFPAGFQTRVDVADVSAPLCGAHRPGHFRGVATVVLKLFELVRPHCAVFGQKDAQQCAVIERMVRDLNLDVEILRGPTLREPDGLALSSRNAYLSPVERAAAPVAYRALRAGEERIRGGERAASKVRAAIEAVLRSEPRVGAIDYVAVVDPADLRELRRIRGEALLAVAIRIGSTRLIDNIPVKVAGD